MARARKVLIVEDDVKVRNEIERVFVMDEEIDFEVISVSAVGDASLAFGKENRRFDLIIIDWRLGPENEGGLKILQDAKKHFAKILIVFTAYASIEDSVRAVKAGADDYIDKNQVGSLQKMLRSAKEKLKAWGFEEHEPDPDWLRDNLEDLRDTYRGELIAFIEGKIIAHAPTKTELLLQVKDIYPDEEPFIMFAPVEV